MKKLECIIRPFKLDEVKEALSNVSRSQTERNPCYEGILHISANSINRRSRGINHHSRGTRDLSAFKR